MKRALWNSEFKGGRWNCLDDTSGDCVYPYVEKYARNGSILDLGCGSGNTGMELDVGAYQQYVGVDISDAAIEQAKRRTEENRRSSKNSYFQSDILSYVPTQQYEVILFREVIYYIATTRVRSMLNEYSKFLKAHGVFIVRIIETTGKVRPIVDIIESNFEIVEKYLPGQTTTAVIVFRQKAG
jgi:methylase of polypeptide subunit release factors